MKNACLPRCFNPVFSNIPCDMPEVPICCISWTMPCGGTTYTITFDVKNLTYGPLSVPMTASEQLAYCNTSRQGTTTWIYVYYGDAWVLYSCNGEIGLTDAGPVWASVTDYSAIECVPEYVTFDDGENLLFAVPYIKWRCVGSGSSTQLLFEAGWMALYYADPPVYASCFQYAVAEGLLPIDWYDPDGDWSTPPPTFTLPPLYDGAPSVEVIPKRCNYFPCGDPLDCFASCISGTKDCDGMTPAHAPVIFITFSSDADCCLNGTFTMRYSDNAASSGCGGGGGGYTITNPPSCEIAGCTYTLCATLSCAKTPLTDGVDYGAGSNFAHLYIKIVDGGGCEMQSFSYVLGMSCSGGLLSNRSGTMVLDSVCGDAHETDMDWVLHG